MEQTSLRQLELLKFSNGAAEALLGRGQLVEFLQSIGYRPEPSGNGWRVCCPVCQRSAAFVGAGGTTHKVFWKCPDIRCPSNDRQSGCKLVKNLLGLVRGKTEGQSLGEALKVIARFLGAASPWDVTNGKLPEQVSFLFVVGAPDHKTSLDRAGVDSLLFAGDYSDGRLGRNLVYVVMDEGGEAVAEKIRKKWRNEVQAVRPAFLFGDESRTRRLAMAVVADGVKQMRRAAS